MCDKKNAETYTTICIKKQRKECKKNDFCCIKMCQSFLNIKSVEMTKKCQAFSIKFTA